MQIRKELEQYMRKIELSFNEKEENKFITESKSLWTYIDNLNNKHKNNEFTEKFNELQSATPFIKLKTFLSSANLHFERLQEIQEAAKIIKEKGKVGESEHLFENLNKFNKDTSSCAQIELDFIEKNHKKTPKIAMVGCGPLPITLISLAKTFPNSKCVAIDNDPEAIAYAKKVTKIYSLENVTFEILNGKNFNYKDIDYTIIANVVTEKTAILNRIATTSRDGSITIIRAPIKFAKLLYETPDFRSSCVFEKTDEHLSTDSDKSIFLKTNRN